MHTGVQSMTKGYTSYRLIHDGSATPVLNIDERFHFPGLETLSDQESDKILLSSGFSSIIKDTSHHISAALQLNGDFSGLDEEQLRSFADADLKRKHQSVFSSYSVEPENLVCVISANSNQLHSFVDTYGGILTIEPLLLSGSDRAFGSVTEIAISYHAGSYAIDFSLRSPIDYSKCNYCGKCAPACPESCISETLYFDFNKCSFCRDCEKICPTGAIDIYTIERRKLTAPALIILGEIAVELPENTEHVYSEETLNDYFSSLYPYQVEEVISCNQSICQYSTRTKSGCSLCIDGCKFGAISAPDGIKINSQKCVECGYCAGVCPTGAIEYKRFEDGSFFEFFRTFSLPVNTVVVLGDECRFHQLWWTNREKRYPGTVFIEYPNNQALSSLHLLFLLAHGASQVLILDDENQNDPLLQHTINEVNKLLGTFFAVDERVSLCSTESFDSIVNTIERKGFLQTQYTNLSYINRRDKLASIIHFFVELIEPVTLSSRSTALFSSIICNENACTQCLACLNECNIQALSADPSALSLSWNGSLCIGCQACVAVCPENALTVGDTITLTSEYFLPAVFAQAEPIRCKECGKVFGTQKSFERVMHILAKQKLDQKGHFEYCEDCRVIKLMDDE